MTTTATKHRPTTSAVVTATGLVGALLAMNLTTAHAIPVADDPTTAGALRVDTDSQPAERFCFKRPQPLSWDDGRPLPPCYVYIPWT